MGLMSWVKLVLAMGLLSRAKPVLAKGLISRVKGGFIFTRYFMKT